MKKGFEIGQSNEVIQAGRIYDLHNLYDFSGVIIKGVPCKFQILFEPNSEHGGGQLPISLNFEEVDYLEFSSNFGTQEISSLDEMGYKNPEDRDDTWLMEEKDISPESHLFFRFDGGSFIRVHCRNADLKVAKTG